MPTFTWGETRLTSVVGAKKREASYPNTFPEYEPNANNYIDTINCVFMVKGNAYILLIVPVGSPILMFGSLWSSRALAQTTANWSPSTFKGQSFCTVRKSIL